MKSLLAKKGPTLARAVKIPNWQRERAVKIQRACRRTELLLSRGVKLKRALRISVWRYRNKPLKCDPERKIALTPATLRRHLRSWQAGGRKIESLFIKYCVVKPRISGKLMERFLEFCSRNDCASLKAAWHQFSKLPSNARKAAKITYYQVAYSFPANDFYEMRSQLRRSQKALKRLAMIRAKLIAEIRNNLPQ